jgi:hypothetical protein
MRTHHHLRRRSRRRPTGPQQRLSDFCNWPEEKLKASFLLSLQLAGGKIQSLSRFSHLELPSPVDQACAAMRVQPSAVGRKAIQYMVLYCLTPGRFHGYSSLNSCLWEGLVR